MGELNKYYSFYEVYGIKDKIFIQLDKFKNDGKILYEYDSMEEILKIEDLDLDESEIDEILQIFEKSGVIPYLERVDDDDDYFGYVDEFSEDDE